MAIVCCVGVLLFTVGWGKSKPKTHVPEKLISSFLKNNIPAFIDLKDLSIEEVPAPMDGAWNMKAKVWMVKYKATYILKENLYRYIHRPSKSSGFRPARYQKYEFSSKYVSKPEQLLQTYINLNNQYIDLLKWEEKILSSRLSGYYPGPSQPENLKRFNLPKFLQATYKKDEKYTVYGKILAIKMLDSWHFELKSAHFPPFDKTFASYGKGYVILGTKEDTTLKSDFKKLIASAEKRRSEVENAIAKHKAEMEEQLQPGTVYSGENIKGEKAILRIDKLCPEQKTFIGTLAYPDRTSSSWKNGKEIKGDYNLSKNPEKGNIFWSCGKHFLHDGNLSIIKNKTSYSKLKLKRVK